MAIDYDHLMSLTSEGERFSYGDRETMLYALGVGMGRDPLAAKELPYVYEKDLKTVPTMATVIAWGAGPLRDSGINYLMVVHGEQKLTLHRPLPAAADIIADSRVVGAWDKGADKGAVIVTETDIRLADTDDKLCTLTSTTFARGDGGFGGPTDGAPKPHALPDRAPDQTIEVDTRADQALLYRLSGDRNPLHADPEFATAAGFPAPILHGLCTYGTCCRAILGSVADYDHTAITGFDVRFSSPVFPGETILVDVWKDGPIASFRARLKERDAVVINNGKCTLKA
ncbi:3-alpha,7-alpha,12-alpha-trihydroxy-5-beta-cholest-24-enoyl-CoA hydratase [Pyruvatibacter mobilis]|uniref:3-alpha,7-alpha, 12-alpha-trihydroxy-5-beta-cholest-24-enoyl-CoA hydratase n=1 Tax=Pyruvatibacter mobilis TaxID=1712261 RepID=A0A845Q7U0_9HYPH|nr:MaoC/PaaZ C-terminal domain-containing protein [Pyruvatibacter mobilis]NBG94715.1 3-alpha,7-alpha,12-alpha-trihydroxy-5-beta-cholest-24-enoyl-CoA hydratase [Pyruvatibacter mobilis]QJD75914.1 3-alpha,7-alpha,12-alpha-trihydroxy-5-beta-cholest-24-enoyl-CoA hydratase [Pyruvatibacter mobilis]GGD19593.1 dehydrogenase [Pyruvatibacter mobilis]